MKGITPLHCACAFQNKEMVHYLIAHGAKLRVKRNNDLTVLHDAVDGRSLEVIEILINAKAMLNARAILAILPALGNAKRRLD